MVWDMIKLNLPWEDDIFFTASFFFETTCDWGGKIILHLSAIKRPSGRVLSEPQSGTFRVTMVIKHLQVMGWSRPTLLGRIPSLFHSPGADVQASVPPPVTTTDSEVAATVADVLSAAEKVEVDTSPSMAQTQLGGGKFGGAKKTSSCFRGSGPMTHDGPTWLITRVIVVVVPCSWNCGTPSRWP